MITLRSVRYTELDYAYLDTLLKYGQPVALNKFCKMTVSCKTCECKLACSDTDLLIAHIDYQLKKYAH